MNNENWPVNQNPTFTKEVKDTKHGKNGIIQIPNGARITCGAEASTA